MNQFSKLVSVLQQRSQEPILNAPASLPEIDDTFGDFGDDDALQEIKDAYLVGNGEADISHPNDHYLNNRACIFGELEFNSTKDVKSRYDFWNDLLTLGDLADNISEATVYPPNTVKQVTFSPGWIPFADGSSEEHLAVDLDPGRNGTKGQIILFGCDVEYLFKVADSFEDFCRVLIALYEKGEIHRWITGRGDWGSDLYRFLCARAGLRLMW